MRRHVRGPRPDDIVGRHVGRRVLPADGVVGGGPRTSVHATWPGAAPATSRGGWACGAWSGRARAIRLVVAPPAVWSDEREDVSDERDRQSPARARSLDPYRRGRSLPTPAARSRARATIAVQDDDLLRPSRGATFSRCRCTRREEIDALFGTSPDPRRCDSMAEIITGPGGREHRDSVLTPVETCALTGGAGAFGARSPARIAAERDVGA